MTLAGLPIHKSIARAAAAGIVVSFPATLAAALASESHHAFEVGSIDLTMWACIAPSQAIAAWLGARVAPLISAAQLSRVFAVALSATGVIMMYSSLVKSYVGDTGLDLVAGHCRGASGFGCRSAGAWAGNGPRDISDALL